jgi:tetratricopeptide (TPR) repeat protein
VPAGRDSLAALRARWTADDSLRARARSELERQAASSRFSAGASSLLADIALVEGRFADAGVRLAAALEMDPATPRAHERLGLVALWGQDPGRALLEFERERRLAGDSAPLEVQIGFASQASGDRAGARRHYQAALRLDPTNPRARQLLESLDRGEGP